MNEFKGLKEFRAKINLTQEEVGKIMGVQREVVSYYETGKREMPITNLKKLLNFIGISLEDFKEGHFEKKIQVAYRKEQIVDEDFEEIIWLNNFVMNLSELKKINNEEV